MPNRRQNNDLLGEVAGFLGRLESARLADGARQSNTLRDIQRVVRNLDNQLARVNVIFERANRLHRSLSGDDDALLPTLFSDSTTTQAPRRSQDEVTHLFTRLVATGFDNF